MSFGRYTTPTIILSFPSDKYPDLDLTAANNVYVTFTSGINSITKTGEELRIDEKEVGAFLTQADTGRFREFVEVQANWTANGGMRYQSNIVRLPVDRNLLERVVE